LINLMFLRAYTSVATRIEELKNSRAGVRRR